VHYVLTDKINVSIHIHIRQILNIKIRNFDKLHHITSEYVVACLTWAKTHTAWHSIYYVTCA